MSTAGRPLEGRVALVTGAGQRLGRAIAEGLGKLGADVAVHFHTSGQGAEEVAARIRADGNRARAVTADLADPAAIQPLLETIGQFLGPVSILVNSAGILQRADFLDTSPELLERLWAVNVRAPFLLGQAAAAGMAKAGRGDIVNVLDVAGVAHTWRHHAAYAMTRAALASLTRSTALELAPRVRVNAIAPGLVLPPDDLGAELREVLASNIPAGGFGSPADVVDTVAFLVAGPRFITGQVLVVDGGRSL
jgi:pteridine reductase